MIGWMENVLYNKSQLCGVYNKYWNQKILLTVSFIFAKISSIMINIKLKVKNGE